MRQNSLIRLLNFRSHLPPTLTATRRMATATQVQLSTTDAGVYHVPDIKKASASKGSQVLQENHEKHHCFFNQDGFHNHIAHHVLTIYALGADPNVIQKGYDANKDYQRSPGKVEERIIQDMHNRKEFLKYLGKEKYYVDFLQFFQAEINQKGIGQTFQDHIFAGDEVANRMLGQLFAGFLHPIIHMGFGVEFNQPAIIAEGLAMCAVSSSWLNELFKGIEQHISSTTSPSSSKTLFDLQKDILSNEKLAHCAKWEDSNKLRDGVIARASKEMIEIASQWRVTDAEELEHKTAEMTAFAGYFTGAAQNPKKQIKFDFYFMHCINASVFFWSFLKQSWLTDAQKCKLLEMKGWGDLAMYVSRNSPELLLDEITGYKEKRPGDWDSVISRVNVFEDDGHASKLVRAYANAQEKCGSYEEKEDWPIKGEMWLKLGHMVIDSVEAEGSHWARSVGFPQAWEGFADRRKPGQPSYEAM